MIINHNISALNTYRQLGINNTAGSKSIEKLSSGLRINRAGDDAAGLAISEKMRAQIRGLNQASRNAQDGISLIQSAEGALNETHNILQRMRELATQASSDTNVNVDRDEIQKEINQLSSEINRIGNTTEFNTMKLLNGGTGQTANIRYSVETAGVTGAASTGEVSTMNVGTASRALGTGAASDVDVITNSTAKVDEEIRINSFTEQTESVVASTAAVSAVDVQASSRLGVGYTVGAIGSVTETQESVIAGTGTINQFTVATESIEFAAKAEIGSPVAQVAASLEGGTGSIQGDAGQMAVKGAVAVAGGDYVANITVDQTADAANALKITIDMDDLIKDGISAGDTITFGDIAFTAKAGDAAGAAEFNIGLTTEETIANLAAKLNDHAGIVGESGSNVTVSVGGVGHETEITFEVDANDETMKWGGPSLAKDVLAAGVADKLTASARNAVYTFEVKDNFSVGDTITIGGTTYTAHATETDNGNNTFKVGDTIEATVANLVTTLNGGDDFAGHTVSAGAPLWGNDTTSITITADVAGLDASEAAFSTNLTVTQTPDVAGQYIFEINSNPEIGSTITIEGQVFTATAASEDGSNFIVGANINDTVTSLTAAITANATLGAKYTASVLQASTGNAEDLDSILLVENSASGQDLADVTVTSADQTEQQGEYSFQINRNFSAGDTITIDGESFEAVNGAAGAGQFTIGADSETTATNLVTAIGLNATLSSRFDAVTAAGDQDNNKVVLTEKLGEATGTDLAAPVATATPAQAGTYQFTLNDNFAAGETITIGGQTFTAVASDADEDAGEFNVGANTDATAANLKSAMEANTTLGDHYTVGLAGSDFTLTEKADQQTGTALTISGTGAAGQVQGEYVFSIDSNLIAGDKITVAGRTFEAVEDAADVDLANGKFLIGADEAETTDNLIAALEEAGTSTATRFDVTKESVVASPVETTYNIKLTEKVDQVTGVDIDSPVLESVGNTAGVYTFNVASNFAVGDTLTINDQTFTAVDADGDNTDSTFKVGNDSAATAANIKAAIEANADLNAAYTVSQAGNAIGLTEKNATGEAAIVDFTSGVAEVRGKYEFELTDQFSVGDTIEIGGTTFTAVGADGKDAEGAVPANAFEIGADVNDTMSNLAGVIDDTLGARFEVTEQTNAFSKTTSIVLEEKAGQATGTDLTNPAVVNITAIEGVYTFDVDTNFAAGDRLTIEGQTFTAVAAGAGNTANTFEVGSDETATAGNLAQAIGKNANFDNYTVDNNGNSIAFTEQAATGEDLTDPAVLSATGVAGEYKFSMSALKAGSTVTIDDEQLVLATGGNETATAAALKTAVEANNTLNAKYTVVVDGAEVTLTQKEGQETPEAPTVAFTTNAGDGYRAQMQIGANTGQSMALDVNDMRADALGISSAEQAVNQTVEVDGKQYQVAWTASQAVTNGTDNVATEFALDISNHDNATAAVQVINDAIETVSAERSKLGAAQNRLEHTIKNLGTSAENLQAAESRIRDLDMASEMMSFTKNNILQQAATAMLAQANQAPQAVLQLLR